MRHCIFTAIMSLGIPLASFNPELAYPIFLLVFLLTGISRSFNFVPDFIVNIYFDAEDVDKDSMRVWVGLTGIGDVVALIAMHILLHWFDWGWKSCMYLSIVAFIAVALAFYYSTE